MFAQHELSALFPSIGAEDFQALVADIRNHGLRHPIVLYQGRVLDGWHRYRACLAAKVHPQATTYTGKDPLALVMSENMQRRHLSESQRALIVVEANRWRQGGRPETLSRDKVTPKTSAITKTNAQLAESADASASTIARAKVVAANGSDALKDAVREGIATVKEAAAIAKAVPKPAQAKALKERPAPPKPAPKPSPNTVPKDEHDKLVEEYNTLRENRDDIAAELEAVEALRTDEHVVKIKQLQAELRACRRSRDTLMAQVADMTKQLQSLKRRLDKATAK